MPVFAYTAKDRKGSLVQGSMDADGRAAVVSRLQQMGYYPVKIQSGGKIEVKVTKEVKKPTPSKNGAQAKEKPKAKAHTAVKRAAAVTAQKENRKSFSFRRGVSTADIASFNRQLADLIGAGVPLVKGLAVLQKQTQSDKLQEIITTILNDVQGGDTFADALSKHPQIFSKLYVAMVRSGEAGGMLDDVLARLADYSESEELLKSKVKSSLAYPVVMIIACLGAVFVMFAFVVPRIVGTFDQLNQALPAMTLLLIAISEFFAEFWYVLVIGFPLLWFGFLKFIQTPDGMALWHRVQLQLPIIGPVIQKREVARFTRTLGSLLQNGVSILVALEIVREVVNNTVVKAEVDAVMDEITQGASVAKPLRGSPVFPPVAVNMIAIGEETGRLPEVLLRVSDSFETDVDRSLKTLTSLIEPIIIVSMGLVVAFVVIGMLLPIFSLDPTGGTM